MVLIKLPIAIVTVISIAGTRCGQVSAEVQYFKSPLDATGRRYACPSESLSFTCEVHGQFLRWTVNSVYLTTFFYDHGENSVDTVTTNEQYDVRAILTRNDPLSQSDHLDASHRRLTSMLILDSGSQNMLVSQRPHNISCSSHTDMYANIKLIQIAETPNMPREVSVSPVSQQDNKVDQQRPGTSNVTLAIVWEEPDNIDRFDFVHYKIVVYVFDVDSGSQYYLNGTSVKPEYHINVPYSSSVNVAISAVSKCSQQVGLESNVVEWIQNYTTTTSKKDVDVKTESDAINLYINGCKRNVMIPWPGLMSFVFLSVLVTNKLIK